jgi:hypothetical protein
MYNITNLNNEIQRQTNKEVKSKQSKPQPKLHKIYLLRNRPNMLPNCLKTLISKQLTKSITQQKDYKM